MIKIVFLNGLNITFDGDYDNLIKGYCEAPTGILILNLLSGKIVINKSHITYIEQL